MSRSSERTVVIFGLKSIQTSSHGSLAAAELGRIVSLGDRKEKVEGEERSTQ